MSVVMPLLNPNSDVGNNGISVECPVIAAIHCHGQAREQ